ncbi:MAG: IS200/IS605 family transposase [Cytophagaceae bacterium]
MSTFTQIVYQIIFTTKNRERTLSKNNRDLLFKYIWGVFKNKNCHLYRINGIEDHIHILTDLHPTISLASLIKDVKLSSTEYIKSNKLFEHFNGWQNGYGAFTYSIKDKDSVVEYIKNQEQHHKTVSFKEEYINLLKQHDIEFEEKYLL